MQVTSQETVVRTYKTCSKEQENEIVLKEICLCNVVKMFTNAFWENYDYFVQFENVCSDIITFIKMVFRLGNCPFYDA